MPLIGKRIMITAPRQYAHKLAAYLIMAGARPMWVPSISITHIQHEDKSKVSLEYHAYERRSFQTTRTNCNQVRFFDIQCPWHFTVVLNKVQSQRAKSRPVRIQTALQMQIHQHVLLAAIAVILPYVNT